ncbi:hypothetical protein [Aliivibrio fischeri]|uniref:hypothetical protein n=1 Tax=Aliivibrio fischeri TaxID=668 RepID=UPI0007C4D2FC|nr:hypothetical protein [Aliivibrio fischeri]
MNSKLNEAIEIIQRSMSHMESLQKELMDTRIALDKKSQELDIEIANNIKLNNAFEKLKEQYEKLSEPKTIESESISRSNRVSEAMAKYRKGRSLSNNEQQVNSVENVSSITFSLDDVDPIYRSVLEKTKILHQFSLERLDVTLSKLKLWLNTQEIDAYQKAKSSIFLQKVTTKSNFLLNSQSYVTNVEELPSTELNQTISKESLFCNVELPLFLEEIGKLTLETFGDSITVSRVLDIGDTDRKKYSKPVALTLSGLKAHLKKRLKQRSSLRITNGIEDNDIGVPDKKILDSNAKQELTLNVQKNTEIDINTISILGPTSKYITKKGKELYGWYIDFLTEDKVRDIDPYTFAVDGRYFVRSKHHQALVTAVQIWSGNVIYDLGNNESVSEDSNLSSITLLGEEIVYAKAIGLPSSVLFEVDAYSPSRILINFEHKYTHKIKTQSSRFWLTLKIFIGLWKLLKISGLSKEAIERSTYSWNHFMSELEFYVEKQITPLYKVQSLPSNVLFDSSFSNLEQIVIVNDKHPFNEEYLLPLNEEERILFIKLYAAWLVAEKQTLSNTTELALQSTRQLLGTEFFHLVDEIQYGEDIF